MEKEDLIYLCTVVGNLSGIPVRLYQDRQLCFYHSTVSLPRDPVLLEQKNAPFPDSHICFHVTPEFFYYGIVNSGTDRIIIGPTRQTALQDQELRNMAFRLGISSDDLPDFLSGMKQIIRFPLESLMQMMCAVNFMVNHEKVTLNDLFGSTENPFGPEEKHPEKQLAGNDTPPAELHNTLAIEQTIMNIIRKGDVAALEAFAQKAPAVRPGVMAREQLRQAKNTFIVTAAEASRAAIRGGMDVEDALTSSDTYIRECEMLTDIYRITRLMYDMILFYTQQVQRIRHGNYATDLVRNVANYVQHHLSESITTDQVADSLFLSRQHLSRRFTREAGIPLAAFIRNEKIEEGKRLLRYTEKPVSAIAAYLGFSSQGHFSRVFKEITGMTPGEYREKKRK